jgi:hypothetical protein
VEENRYDIPYSLSQQVLKENDVDVLYDHRVWLRHWTSGALSPKPDDFQIAVELRLF